MAEKNGLLRNNAALLVLAVLKSGPKHGYEIARDVEVRSEKALEFKHGTLYPVLHSMEKNGLIASEWVHEEGERPRRVYNLTDAGLAELQRGVRTWADFSRAMDRVIGMKPGEQLT